MAYSNYFRRFPITQFEGKDVTNLLTTVTFADTSVLKSAIYYDYLIKDGERPDTISKIYYDDSRYDWVILLVNNIYDIYSQWPLDTNQMQNYLIGKYGSLQNANQIKHYIDAEGSIIDKYTYDRTPIGEKEFITYSEWEYSLNEDKRRIKILDSSYLGQVNLELKEILNSINE